MEVKSLLDARITVPLARRTPTWHFHEICAAVTAATGITLKDHSPYLNEYFAPSSMHFNAYTATREDLEKVSFDWGATDMIAREALISLLQHSSTTMSWRLLCGKDEGYCVLNMGAVEVNILQPDGKTIYIILSNDREKASNPRQ